MKQLNLNATKEYEKVPPVVAQISRKLIKLITIIVLLFTSIVASEQPKIALVLSGGGARGGAHVGVLKVLEENNIPVHMIVGTSMGSFVGGLYASGKTPQEIEELLTTTDWKKYITTDFNRADTSMRKKEIEYTYQGKLGLGINSDNELVLPTGVLKRQPMLFKFLQETQHVEAINDFSKLPIPFKAVATDIKNGDAVVLDSGSLAKSIYASSSIPGGFQPVNINGIDLVDGGVSDNFPIELAKKMGADIIIAVDVSENFDENLDVNSYFVVMGQLINILMRKNANESIDTLSDKDILLTPNLDGFSGLDADKYVPIIQAGVEITQSAYEEKLKKLSISQEDYERYKVVYRTKLYYHTPVIDKIEIDNPTYLSDDSILNRLHVKIGEILDEDALRKDLLHIYNLMVFDSIDYEVKEENSKTILVIKTTPSWDNHGEVRFAIGLEDDFKGHSSYSLKLGYTMFGLNAYGGEWKTDFEIGRTQRAYTEIFQPLDSMQRYYLRPSIVTQERVEMISLSKLGLTQISGNHELISSRNGAAMAIGMHVTTDHEFEIGISSFKDEVEMEVFNSSIITDPALRRLALRKYDAKPIYGSFKSDSLDNIHFPEVGYKSEILWTKELSSLDSDYDYEQIYVELEKPLTLWNNNITAYFKYGKTYNIGRDVNGESKTALEGSYSLGGLFNLSGYAPYSFNSDNMLLGVLRYRYKIKDGGFFGALNSPLYAGFSVESGNTWLSDYESFDQDELKYSASVYVAADTILGPFYLAFGSSIEGDYSGYLYLGEKF